MNLCDMGIHKVIQEPDSCLVDLYCESNRRDSIIPDNHLSAVIVLFLLVPVRKVRYFEALFAGSCRNGEEKRNKDEGRKKTGIFMSCHLVMEVPRISFLFRRCSYRRTLGRLDLRFDTA
jgi:hypothetical protein